MSNYLVQVYVHELNVRDFDADANRVRDWVNQMGYPQNVRIECNANATEELKSNVSVLNSQSASRTETPMEEIPRTPSPNLGLANSMGLVNDQQMSQEQRSTSEKPVSNEEQNLGSDISSKPKDDMATSGKGKYRFNI